ncbi:MAG: hypothetical protein M3P38_12635 [Chloroflexota bacterium]|nr:hypothetical protein [Chloroflexota bacterium]
MNRRFRLALPLVLIALFLGSATPAAAVVITERTGPPPSPRECGGCWLTLIDDIETLAPSVLQSSLLAKVDAAMAATDRANFCAAENILGALVNQLEGGLGGPDTIGDPNTRTLVADVADVLGSLPPGPCGPAPHL